METQLTPVEVFYSFAEADAPFLEQLERHLSLLRHEGYLSTWHQRQIVAGSNWQEELDRHLNTASLILLLVSSDFLASDYCYGTEMRRALQRYEAKEAQVLPILLRSCDWQSAPFATLQALPLGTLPISMWSDRDAAWADVVAGIRQVLHGQEPGKRLLPRPTEAAIWNIPFARNPFFTGRDDLLKRLHLQLQTMQAAALSQPQAISGLGGIGKTQLALEYSYHYRQEYQAILWARADTTEALNASYTEIVRLLDLPQQDAQEQEVIVQAVKEWLRTHQGWLLILDNADELDLVQPFLPTACPGHLLLTTRAQTLGKLARRFEVETLDTEVGALLLLRRASLVTSDAPLEAASPSDRAIANALTEELGGLPLAIDQAGAYIEEAQCGLADYLQQYQTRRAELLAHRGMLVDDHPEPVATTWSLSFAKVEAANPMAAEVLRICAFLAPDAIPEELLVEALKTPLPVSQGKKKRSEREGWFSRFTSGQQKKPEPSRPPAKEEQVDEEIALLRAYSLIQRNVQTKTLSIHRLVQAVLREALEREGKRRAWVKRIVHVVEEALPEITFENWKRCEQYVPHAQECVQWAAGMIIAEEAQILHWMGAYLLERQRTQEAGRYVQQALTLREQYLGGEHLETAVSLDRVARWWELQGKYVQAEPLYARALAIYEQELGAEHPATAISLNNLALLYGNQGKYAQAEPLYVRALAIREQQLGAEHPDTASSLNNLAGLYDNQGRYAQAEPLYVRALAIREQQLGAEHPDTASSLNNLALLYDNQGKYAQAEPLYVRALAIREQQLGAEHPATANSLNNLAGLYKSQGKYAQAEPLYVRALAIREQQLGAEHPATATSLNNLAGLYKNQGKYAQATPLFQRALTIREHTLGREHPDTALSVWWLATLFEQQQDYQEAKSLYERALSTYEQTGGSEHQNTQSMRKQYATLLEKMKGEEDVQ